MATVKDRLRMAAVGDLHCGKTSQGKLQPLFAAAAEQADVLLLCGDLTDYGLPEEAQLLVKELSGASKIQVIAVLGNHDWQSGKQEDIGKILTDAGVRILNGDAVEIDGVGFAGTKGFAGGFDDRALQPWGEPLIKQFVHEALEESLKLETALAKLRTPHRIALLHYSPIKTTVEGEPLEIFPFLGSSRLEEPLLRYPVTAVFHGHAHHGQVEGRTRNQAPVFNVAQALLQRTYPDRPPFFLYEVPLVLAAA